MDVRHPMGALLSFSTKYIFYDKINVRLFYFDFANQLIKFNKLLC